MFNKLMILGKVNKKELKYTKDGMAILELRMNTSKKYKDEWQNEYFNCKAFGKAAELINQYAMEKELLYIEGSQKTRKWQDNDGKDRYTSEIVVDNFSLIGSIEKKNAPEVKDAKEIFHKQADQMTFDSSAIPF